MNKKENAPEEKKAYDTPKVLASYDKEDLEDIVGVDNVVQGGGLDGTPDSSGGGCGCGSILQ